jgi:hypothetical protein
MPDESVGAVIESAGSTVIVIVPEVAVPPCESVTLTVKLNAPAVTDDMIVPLMLPEPLRLKPDGRFPEFTTQSMGPTPPVAVRAVEG